MKKIFTLIAMALVAMSVNAKQAIDFTQIEGFSYGQPFTLGGWAWKGVTLAQGEPVKDEEAKTADDSNVIYFDASAWDYVVVKYSSSTADISLIAQYKCLGTIGQWGTEFAQGQSTINASTEPSYAALALDADQKKTVNQIAIQGGNNGGTITIEEVYFATADEWEAVKPAPAQTKSILASFSGTANDDGSKTITPTKAWDWIGAWLGSFDASYFDYLVVELTAPVAFSVKGVAQYVANDVSDSEGFVQPGSLMVAIPLDAAGKAAISQVALQPAEASDFTVKDVYFATQKFIDEIPEPETQEVALSGLSPWEDRATFDAATGVLTITGDPDGGAGWWQGDKDFSGFDNFVVELASTTAGGGVSVQYVAEAAEAPSHRANATSDVTFGVGATCVVVPLNAAYKDHVQQMWIQGDKGASYTIQKVYFAKASATPEANIGTITGIATVNAALQQNGVRYNLAGQKVDASYKGVVIENGKKMMVK